MRAVCGAASRRRRRSAWGGSRPLKARRRHIVPRGGPLPSPGCPHAARRAVAAVAGLDVDFEGIAALGPAGAPGAFYGRLTLTRSVRLAQGFTFVRCCGSPRASSPHGLTAPAPASHDGEYCVQLPPARGCYHLAPRRTFTSNPVPMPGTPTSQPLCGKDSKPGRTPLIVRGNLSKSPEPALPAHREAAAR